MRSKFGRAKFAHLVSRTVKKENLVPAPAAIIELVERFEMHRESYQSSHYNETQLRREFIDPFFKSLGWDVDNEKGWAEAYKDVIHEDAIRIGGTTKAPDYCFRIGGQRKYFVETKKPSVNIGHDVSPAFQLRRYAWTAKLPLSILTDFEEFAVYDCLTFKPHKNDKASTARTLYLKYTEYAERWDDIACIFSRDAILKGSFDKYAERHKKKRGTAEVDTEFLKEIEHWRSLLARNIALRNPKLSQRELNFAVQRTIDRIIFLRICEDRGIEPTGRLQALLNGPQVYRRLGQLFEAADDRYNSGLFHFHKEKDRPEPADELTLCLSIDDKPLGQIIQNLYYPDSPYEFSVLPADILGQVYEQFLGKVIRLTKGHQAKIEEKPEVKKAGGVYYTPTYIVDYIVQQTLGKLLEGKTPQDVGGLTKNWKPSKSKQPLTVLDPACGSGSFLIGAYQKLLDWYRDWYVEDDPQKHPNQIHEAAACEWRLTTAERKRILLSHIYGVDIDPQAVEVTKLSLLLKVLEGENQETLNRQLKFFHERALPDLSSNIKCGNSLIGPDFYDGQQMTLFDEDEMLRINAFDWQAEFTEIVQGGGFDVVIGNPPYIFTREQLTPADRKYFSLNYQMSWEKQNTFMLFMEKLLGLIAQTSKGAFIVPNSWLTIESAQFLRQAFTEKLELIADLNYAVFQKVSMEPTIFIVSGNPERQQVTTCRVVSRTEFSTPDYAQVERDHWKSTGGRIVFSQNERTAGLINQITARCATFGDFFEVRTGLQAYERGKGNPSQTAQDVKDHIFDRTERENADSYRYLQGRDVRRWATDWSGMWMQYGEWLAQPRELGMFTRPRVLLREITSKPPHSLNAVFVDSEFLNNKSVLNVLEQDDRVERLKLLAAVLNSRLLTLFYKERGVKSARKMFPKVVIRNLREFPFPKTLDAASEKKMAQFVDRIQALYCQIEAAKTNHQNTVTERQIETTDRQIDRLVYELYGLTDDEIRIVEEATR